MILLWLRLPMSGFLILIVVASYLSGWLRMRMEEVFYVTAFIFAFYTLYLNVLNNFKFQYIMALINTIWGVGLIAQNLKFIRIFYSAMMLAIFVPIIFYIEPHFPKIEIIQNFAVSFVISYIVIHFKIANEVKLSEAIRQFASLNVILQDKNEQIKRQKKEIEQTSSELEYTYSQITDSLNYASRIQNSILPKEEILSDWFQDAFIYYKPRDIVGGDFYWFHEEKDSLIVVLADCTGHSVPGALMTVLGNTLLNTIIRENETKLPSEILHALDDRVYAYLNKDKSDINDGMDAAVLHYGKITKQLTYSGALIPLYHFQKDELIKIKASKNTIGGFLPINEKVFVNHEVKANKGDGIYFFTDGFRDQLGGPFNKKYSLTRLDDVLHKIHHKPGLQQKLILDREYSEWRKLEEQTDDILAIGLKI